MKTILIALLALLALSGCASDQELYYKAVAAQAEAAKTEATERSATLIKACAASGKESVCLLSAFSLGIGQAGGSGQATPGIQPPKSFLEHARETVRDVFQAITPLGVAAIQARSMNHQSDNSTALGIAQSNNATATAASTNAPFVGISSHIQAPAANITTSTSLGGSGVIGNGSFTTNANPMTTTTTTTTANRNCTGTGAGSGNTTGTTTPSTGAGGSGSANC